MFKKCSTDKRFIWKRKTNYKIHTLTKKFTSYPQAFLLDVLTRKIKFSLLQNKRLNKEKKG